MRNCHSFEKNARKDEKKLIRTIHRLSTIDPIWLDGISRYLSPVENERTGRHETRIEKASYKKTK